MTVKERFHAIMDFGSPDRMLYWEQDRRPEALAVLRVARLGDDAGPWIDATPEAERRPESQQPAAPLTVDQHPQPHSQAPCARATRPVVAEVTQSSREPKTVS